MQLSGRLKSTNTRVQNVLGYVCISSKVSNILDVLNEPFSQKKGGFQLEFSLFTGFVHLEKQERKKTDAGIQWNHLKLQTVVEEKTTRDKTYCNTLYMFRENGGLIIKCLKDRCFI